jgi:uncharacterized membrane protein
MNSLAALSLVIGITFSIVSLFARFFPPRTMDSRYGFRTKLSMRNMDTWREAHIYSSRLLLVASIAMLALGLVFAKRQHFEIYHFAIVIGALVFFIVGIIYMTERRLRHKFDENGKRRS